MPPRRGRTVSHPYRGRGRPTARVQPNSSAPSATQVSITPTVEGGSLPPVSRVSDLSMEEFVSLVGRLVGAQRGTTPVTTVATDRSYHPHLPSPSRGRD